MAATGGNGSESCSTLLCRWFVWFAVCIASVATIGMWIAMDPMLVGTEHDWSVGLGSSLVSFGSQVSELRGMRRYGMIGLLACAAISGAAWLGLMLAGRSTDRSIRSYLCFTGACAIWLAFLGSWNEIAWLGKQWRATQYVSAFEPIAEELRHNWPHLSGDHKLVGMYMSYPTVQPQSMILMACPQLPLKSVSFNGVERTQDGGVAFAMVGVDGGDWLEWHPSGFKPQSFVTGLQQDRNLRRVANLRDGWFLVRYLP